MAKQANKAEKVQELNVDSMANMVDIKFLCDVKTHKKDDVVMVGKYIAKDLYSRNLVDIV